jgi:hypothetical protein
MTSGSGMVGGLGSAKDESLPAKALSEKLYQRRNRSLTLSRSSKLPDLLGTHNIGNNSYRPHNLH